MCAAAREDGIEIAHLTTPGPVGLTALYAAAKLKVPLIGSFHTRAAVMNDQRSDPTVAAVLADLMRRPGCHLVACWNWKAAVLSALLRGALFFAVNLRAGVCCARRTSVS